MSAVRDDRGPPTQERPPQHRLRGRSAVQSTAVAVVVQTPPMRRVVGGAVLVVAFATGCGGGDGVGVSATPTPSAVPTTTTAAVPLDRTVYLDTAERARATVSQGCDSNPFDVPCILARSKASTTLRGLAYSLRTLPPRYEPAAVAVDGVIAQWDRFDRQGCPSTQPYTSERVQCIARSPHGYDVMDVTAAINKVFLGL